MDPESTDSLLDSFRISDTALSPKLTAFLHANPDLLRQIILSFLSSTPRRAPTTYYEKRRFRRKVKHLLSRHRRRLFDVPFFQAKVRVNQSQTQNQNSTMVGKNGTVVGSNSTYVGSGKIDNSNRSSGTNTNIINPQSGAVLQFVESGGISQPIPKTTTKATTQTTILTTTIKQDMQHVQNIVQTHQQSRSFVADVAYTGPQGMVQRQVRDYHIDYGYPMAQSQSRITSPYTNPKTHDPMLEQARYDQMYSNLHQQLYQELTHFITRQLSGHHMHMSGGRYGRSVDYETEDDYYSRTEPARLTIEHPLGALNLIHLPRNTTHTVNHTFSVHINDDHISIGIGDPASFIRPNITGDAFIQGPNATLRTNSNSSDYSYEFSFNGGEGFGAYLSMIGLICALCFLCALYCQRTHLSKLNYFQARENTVN